MAGSEAAWQAALMGVPRRHSRDAAQGWNLCPPHRRSGGNGLFQLVPVGRRRTQCCGTAALGNARRGRPDHGNGRRPPSARRWCPGSGSRPFRRGRHRASARASADFRPYRRRVTESARKRPLDHCDRPADLRLRWPTAIRADTGAEALAFFDAIAPIVYAESVDMSVAWMQSRYDKGETEEEQTAYMNCPMDRAAIRGLHRRASGRRKDRIPRRRDGRIFRRLPAHRGDGGTRPRNPALWPDEAGGPDQPAPAGRQALCGRAIAPRQRTGDALQHRRAFRPR